MYRESREHLKPCESIHLVQRLERGELLGVELVLGEHSARRA